jgi:hypothetical protein
MTSDLDIYRTASVLIREPDDSFRPSRDSHSAISGWSAKERQPGRKKGAQRVLRGRGGVL